jgi:hypothetical protein
MKLKQSKFDKVFGEAHIEFAENRKKKKYEIMRSEHKYDDKKKYEIMKQTGSKSRYGATNVMHAEQVLKKDEIMVRNIE